MKLGRGNYSRHLPGTSQTASSPSPSEKASGSGQTILPIEGLTNDESTWTDPVPATEEDEVVLSMEYVPALCTSFVYEREGGRVEVYLSDSKGNHRFVADNVLPDGRLAENKSGLVTPRAGRQFSNYLWYLAENGGSLDYNFFRSPINGKVGPTRPFASMLEKASRVQNIETHFFDYDWWEELQ